MGVRWIPLEANPDVLNAFAGKIGVDVLGSKFAFQDVYGLDAELLGFIPRPVVAVILLYPLTAEREAARLAELAEQPETDQDSFPQDLFYMKQTIGNACGTIAMVHCLANVCAEDAADATDAADGQGGEGGEGGEARLVGTENTLVRQKGGWLDTFLSETSGMTPEGIGSYLEAGRGCAGKLHGLHGEAAQGGATQAPGVDEEINLHFVAFVEKGGVLWELDGRRAGPVRRGVVEGAGEGIMEAVARVVETEYVQGGGGDIHFNLIALAKSSE